jgi:hypothetical protein
MKKIMWVILTLMATLSLTGCCCCCASRSETSSRLAKRIQAGPVQRETHDIGPEQAEQVDVIVQFGGGEIYITEGGESLLSGEFVYNLDELKPAIEYDVKGKQGRLHIRHEVDAIRWDRFTDKVRNEWTLRFTREMPLDMHLDVGGSSGELDLGRLQITGLDLTVGAADMKVSFDEPNPARMGSMHVRSGAARLEVDNLGNANLEELTFDGGVGSYTFDFSGQWQRSADVNIQAGASNILLRVPHDVGVRVCPGSLRGGDYDKLKKQDDCYVNERYGESDITLDIHLDVGLSDLRIKQVN